MCSTMPQRPQGSARATSGVGPDVASVGPACRAICVEPRCPAPLTWDEQLKLFKRRVVLAINRVGTTFGRFLALEVLLCDGCTLLGAPESVGRTLSSRPLGWRVVTCRWIWPHACVARRPQTGDTVRPFIACCLLRSSPNSLVPPGLRCWRIVVRTFWTLDIAISLLGAS